MRYLGNKSSLIDNIRNVLEKENVTSKKLVFFDAFCGTGTVSNELREYFDIIINDNLLFATTYASGNIQKNIPRFKKLGFDPISYFNSNSEVEKGFFYKNYAPTVSGRMYFTDYNASRIDYFRNQIEGWKNDRLLSNTEYDYLLSCLIESVSKVANIAGVYGAYLKKWDPRAVKEIIFRPVEGNSVDSKNKLIKKYNNNLIDIIEKVQCDILYMDPPYTKNKYTVQYHLLETLIKNDNPEVSGVTGGRKIDYASNAWSIPGKVEVEFDYCIAKTKAKYVLISYSSDGIMSKEFINNVLKRYCVEETIRIVEIPYKKYKNYKSNNDKEHFEYLFFARKKSPKDIVYTCPLNYMGGKSNVIDTIKEYIGTNNRLIDLMAGGFNVGINTPNHVEYFYNDINFIVKDLVKMFMDEDTASLLSFIEKEIKKSKLEKHNKDAYNTYRELYNVKYRHRDDYYKYLFVLLMYGFQQQLRFNAKHEFNNTVGESGYNDSIKEKITSFSRKIKELQPKFYSNDFEGLINCIDSHTTVYIDPPYLITLGSYNDGKRGFKGWSNSDEVRLLEFLNNVKEKRCRILLTNVLEYKTKTNDYLLNWINENEARVVNYSTKNRKEVLVIYDSQVLY